MYRRAEGPGVFMLLFETIDSIDNLQNLLFFLGILRNIFKVTESLFLIIVPYIYIYIYIY